MAQAGPFCRTCQCEKTTNWKCVTCGIIMCESCNEKHLQINQEHQCTNKSENTITHTRCKYHKDYYCTDVCLSCIKVICAKCRSERHTHHRLELIETFYQDKRIELLKCKSTLETHLQSQHAQATDEATLIKISEDLHLEHFEQEKQKVLKQAEDLKQRISERSHKLVDQLEESHQTYKSTTQNKFKLKITDRNLKTQVKEIDRIEQSFMKSIQNQNSEELQKASRESRELNKLSNNAKSYTQQYDFPTLIPRSVKRFNPIEIYGEVFGDLENCSILDDVSLTQVNSYDINNADGISALTVRKDGTIWISHSAGLVQISPNGKVNAPQAIKNIYDISVLESKGLLIAYRKKNSIDIQSDIGLYKKFYEKTNLNALALHVCRDGKIIVLTWSNYRFLFDAVTLNIIELTNDGKYIKTVPCNGKSYRMQTYECAFRISENINGHFCVSDEFGGKIVDYDEKGDHVWSYRECENPYGLVTSKLGNIVINDSNEFIYILNSDGEFLTKLNTKEHGQTRYKSALSFKSDKELLILSTDKLILLEFSTVI